MLSLLLGFAAATIVGDPDGVLIELNQLPE